MDQLTTPSHLVVLTNPSPKSFCHTIAHTYANAVKATGQRAIVHDLYASGFDPVLRDIERRHVGNRDARLEAELRNLSEADALILVYPIWFGGPPAMLKGYIDRVLGSNDGYRRLHEGRVQPLIRGRHLFSITTSFSPVAWLEERGQPRALREGFDLYLERSSALIDAGHLSLGEISANMSSARVAKALAEVTRSATSLCLKLAVPQ